MYLSIYLYRCQLFSILPSLQWNKCHCLSSNSLVLSSVSAILLWSLSIYFSAVIIFFTFKICSWFFFISSISFFFHFFKHVYYFSLKNFHHWRISIMDGFKTLPNILNILYLSVGVWWLSFSFSLSSTWVLVWWVTWVKPWYFEYDKTLDFT